MYPIIWHVTTYFYIQLICFIKVKFILCTILFCVFYEFILSHKACCSNTYPDLYQ